MKYIILWLNLLFILSACQNRPTDELFMLLKKADSIAETSPDSAYAILSSIKQPEEMNNRNFAYWCLISSKIFGWRIDNEKTYLPASYYNRAYRYYMRYGSTEEKSFIRLYLGRAYQKETKYNKAMQIFAEALKDAVKWKEYDAAGMISIYMGDIYQIQFLSDKCKEKYKEAIHFFTLAGNQKRIVYGYAQLGFEYLCNEEPEESIIYMLQADSIATLIQDSIQIGDISYYLGVTYSELREYATAEQYLQKAIQFSQVKSDSSIIYYAICDVHVNKGNYKEARNILDQGLSNNNRNNISHQKYRIEKGEQNFEQALSFLESWQQTLDSIYNEHKKMHVLEIEQKYNREYTENQRNKAQVQASGYFILLLIIVITLLCLIVFYLNVRKQKNKIIDSQRQELSKTDGIISHITKQLEHEKEKVSLQKAGQQKRIATLKEELFNTQLEKITLITPVGKKIRRIARSQTQTKKVITDNEWKAVTNLSQKTFSALKTLFDNPAHPFTETEIRLTILQFFRLDPKQEAIILEIAPVSIYKQRTRLRQKLHLEDNTNLFEFFKAFCIEYE